VSRFASMHACVQQVDELLGPDGVGASHLAQALEQLGEVAVDEVALQRVRVSDADDLVPALLCYELGRVRCLRERVAHVEA